MLTPRFLVRTMTNQQPHSVVRVAARLAKGTLFLGGAGLNGDYLNPLVQAFKDAGINYVWTSINLSATQRYSPSIGTLIDAAKAGITLANDDGTNDWRIDPPETTIGAKQLNFIGYSYGSLLAAQMAKSYAEWGHIVDHLVLIASPIEANFLAHLKTYEFIKKITIINLTEHGDPIHAGIGFADLAAHAPLLGYQMTHGQGEGHFYYAHMVPDASTRWKN